MTLRFACFTRPNIRGLGCNWKITEQSITPKNLVNDDLCYSVECGRA